MNNKFLLFICCNNVMVRRYEVFYVKWEEFESGWGPRPDGCSLHLTVEDFKEFVNEYEKEMRVYWKKLGEKPYECSSPVGSPQKAEVEHFLYEKIRKSRNGIRLLQDEEKEAVERKKLVTKGLK